MLHRFEQFTLMLSRLNRYVHIIEDAEMKKFGLKGAHAHSLLVLSMNPNGLTAAQLSNYCEIDKAAVSRLITHLEKENLIYRNSENPYRAPIILSPKGVEIANKVNEKILLAVAKASEGLSEKERAALYKSFDILSENLKAICQKEGNK